LEKLLDKSVVVKKVIEADDIPFNLLLLADETMTVIKKYVYTSDVYVVKEVLSEQVIASFVLQKINSKEIEIKNIAVDELYQGRGIGSLLIQKIKQMALEQGMHMLWVGTPDSATRQLNFYLRNGFRKAGVRTNFFLNNYPEPIYENGVYLRDMVMLKVNLKEANNPF
jgi:ribosomal protein S18 acetylase RimI-like enzyme